MADFRRPFIRTGGNEGGSQFNPDDKGNLPGLGTYKGIASRPNPNWRGWLIIKAEIANLTPQPEYGTTAYKGWVKELDKRLNNNASLQRYVQEFFKAEYWDHYLLDGVADQAVADWVYDHVVNGRAQGVKWLQEALNHLGANLVVDGGLGKKTLDAINVADPAKLLREAEDVAAFYRIDRAAGDPTQIQFLPSWLRRDGVSEEEIKEVMKLAKDGLTYAEVATLKGLIAATA